MRFVIISDTHFGDREGTLVSCKGDVPEIGPRYDEFKERAGERNDYLILLGDILDFSIENYNDVYPAARVFFRQIQKDKIARKVIYVPGNHDFDLWDTIEYEVNVICQIKEGDDVSPFRMSVPGVIDDRFGSLDQGFKLYPGLTKKRDPEESSYDGLFLDSITTSAKGHQGKPTKFIFTYPNLYIVTDEESILITHGHYLELYWEVLGEIARLAFRDKLNIANPDSLAIKEMVSMNFPLCQLACSGVGQAGPLTDVVQKVQRSVKDRKPDDIKDFLNRLDDAIDTLTSYRWWHPMEVGREVAKDAASGVAKWLLKRQLGKYKDTRYNKEFMEKKEVQRRFADYFKTSCREIRTINEKFDQAIPDPHIVIFGHTHDPVPWGASTLNTENFGIPGLPKVMLYNTGGWLNRRKGDEVEFCGAEVFTYRTGEGFKSYPIGYERAEVGRPD